MTATDTLVDDGRYQVASDLISADRALRYMASREAGSTVTAEQDFGSMVNDVWSETGLDLQQTRHLTWRIIEARAAAALDEARNLRTRAYEELLARPDRRPFPIHVPAPRIGE